MHSSIPPSPQVLLQKSTSLLWTHKPALEDVSDTPTPLKWPQMPRVVDKIWPSESVEMLERPHMAQTTLLQKRPQI